LGGGKKITNFRLTIPKTCITEFKYCFTCGRLLIEDENDRGEKSLTCSKNSVHLRVFISDDEDQKLEFE
jgi:hypothetical protein